MCRAVGLRRYGGPDVLELLNLDVPGPGPAQVRIAVVASPVNPADAWLRSGGVAHLMGDAPWPFVPGLELAGTVEAVGPGAGRVVGEAVVAVTTFVGTGRGAHAGLVVVDAHDVVPKPLGVSFAAASTVPMSGSTAELCLETLQASPGDRIAVTGSDGVVGRFVVELARDRGIEVVALTRRRGPDVLPSGLHGVVDCALVGAPVVASVRRGGRLVALRPVDPSTAGAATGAGVTTHLVSVRTRHGHPARLAALMDRVADGVLTTRVAQVAPPAHAAALHRRLERGAVGGRLVLDWSGETT